MEITNWFGLDGWFTLLTLLDKCVFLWFELKDGARLDLMNDMTCYINYMERIASQ
jgi:hypothetical protein